MYEILAEYYDRFMTDVPYDEWVKSVARILGSRKRGRNGSGYHADIQPQSEGIQL